MNREKLKLTLDKSKWICGNPQSNKNKNNCMGEGHPQLLNLNGYMCCLGQFMKCMGVNDHVLLGQSLPSNTNRLIEPLTFNHKYSGKRQAISDTRFTEEAASINDNEWTSVDEKIECLKSLCESNNIELEVIN